MKETKLTGIVSLINFYKYVTLILTCFHWTDVQFEKIEAKGCSYNYETFSNITSAEERCRRDSSCKGVWDRGCDESTDDVCLCKVGYEYNDYSGECIYDKKGRF